MKKLKTIALVTLGGAVFGAVFFLLVGAVIIRAQPLPSEQDLLMFMLCWSAMGGAISGAISLFIGLLSLKGSVAY